MMLHARDLLSFSCDYQISDSHDGEYQDQGFFWDVTPSGLVAT